MRKSRLRLIIGRGLVLAVVFLGLMASAQAQKPEAVSVPAAGARIEEPDSCTSIQVGRLATIDGSVITCHTCDGMYRQWVNIVPRQKWPDKAMNKVYSGKMHTETPTDLRGIVQTGEVPQVAETYRFLNTAYPSLNEMGLAIGETTIGGRRELVNNEGIFMIEELERIALERCKTAREAIALIGGLVKQYGYGDDGECITIADGKEVWHFEIMGAGPLEKGAVWAAVRIPDDHVGISANIPRIAEIDLKNPDRFLASDNVFQLAQDMGWWDPKSGKPFKFWEAYNGRRPFSTREYFVLSTLAPSLKLTMDMPELPFSVKPEKKLSVRDVLALYRNPYEGTDLDMTRNMPQFPQMQRRRPGDAPPATPAAPPQLAPSSIVSAWMPRDLMAIANALKPGTIAPQRTIPISGCSYATVLQVRGWLPPAVGAICWFSFDNPAMSARIPIFAGTTELPPGFEICAQHNFRLDSAAWAFRRANRLATLKWGQTRKTIEATIAEFEDKAFADLPLIEKKVQEILASKTPDREPFTVERYLTKYTNDTARAAVQRYLELGDKFWMLIAMSL
ncbi:MAG TPA: C69 family dipeptidase [Candidatus Aminicenantes bacterium]|nr:C69 family dipeptidase [Candidatus Aminicenantes bacterium]HRY65295.1 C69 family dipeptidase [Candidatus Aminicenantes bacterium]HRZ72237.1 C69 family dipeptidase [Candidatus Aminicenantes bacterium]